MARFFPIVFSEEAVGGAEIAATGIAQAVVDSGSISVFHATADGTEAVQMPIPEKALRLEDLSSHNGTEWAFLAQWFRKKFGSNVTFVVDANHPLRNFAILAKRVADIGYTVRIHEHITPLSPKNYAFFGGANAFIFESDALEADFRTKYVGPYRVTRNLSNVAAGVPLQARGRPSPEADVSTANRPKRLLLVAYFSGPSRSVGAQRINYWFEEIERISGGEIEVELATATDWGLGDHPSKKAHYVPDQHIAELIDDDGSLPLWAQRFRDSEIQNASHFNTLSHYWRIALERYFESRDSHFDWVLISGSPFPCFDFAAFAKRIWYANVVFDYREPFANNPRMLYGPEGRERARYCERGYNFQADLAIAVNNTCKEMIEAPTGLEVTVVENGFDERVLDRVTVRELAEDRINFVHAGSFGRDRNPRVLLETLDPTLHRFHHVGNAAGIDPDLLPSAALNRHGYLPYVDTLGVIGGAQCGVIFLSESTFETTTKVYDYLAMGIDILVLLDAPEVQKTGALGELLARHPRVHWVANTPEGIREFLAGYSPSVRDGLGDKRFSRRRSTSQLVDTLLRLCRT